MLTDKARLSWNFNSFLIVNPDCYLIRTFKETLLRKKLLWIEKNAIGINFGNLFSQMTYCNILDYIYTFLAKTFMITLSYYIIYVARIILFRENYISQMRQVCKWLKIIYSTNSDNQHFSWALLTNYNFACYLWLNETVIIPKMVIILWNMTGCFSLTIVVVNYSAVYNKIFCIFNSNRC